MKVLVTGANGFVGRAFIDRLRKDPSIDFFAAVRDGSKYESRGGSGRSFVIRESLSKVNWLPVLDGLDVVVHLAARAHILEENSADPLAEFREVNLHGTINLAEQAILSGVKRFIYVSSIGVNGEVTSGVPFTEVSTPHPKSDYAVSKYEAEHVLFDLFRDTGIELVIIRPPLIYSADAPGNFSKLLGAIWKGLPFPLAGVVNKRSFVYLDNFVDFVFLCLSHPLASGHIFLISDGRDFSTPEIIRIISGGMGLKPRLVHVPDFVLRFGACVINKKRIYSQLCSSLQIDSSKANALLGWRPPVDAYEGLRLSGEIYARKQKVI